MRKKYLQEENRISEKYFDAPSLPLYHDLHFGGHNFCSQTPTEKKIL